MGLVLTIETPGQGLHEMTGTVAGAVSDTDVRDGLCVLFVQHTSASLTIQENADPSARPDLEAWLTRTIREDDPCWTHTAGGPDDMPSQVRAMRTGASRPIPIRDGQRSVGAWQGSYLS